MVKPTITWHLELTTEEFLIVNKTLRGSTLTPEEDKKAESLSTRMQKERYSEMEQYLQSIKHLKGL